MAPSESLQQPEEHHKPDIDTTWKQLNKSKFYSVGVLASFGLRAIFFPISLMGAHQVANMHVGILIEIWIIIPAP